SVCADGQGGLWIGYNYDRIEHQHDGKTESFNLIADPKASQNSYVKSVFVDRDQRVWAGIWFKFSGDSRASQFRLFQLQNGKFQPAPGLETIVQDISALHQDRQGGLWIGTEDGLARWDGKAVQF